VKTKKPLERDAEKNTLLMKWLFFIPQHIFDYTFPMNKPMHNVACLLAVLILCCPFISFGSTFNLTCETSAGFETSLYNPKDSLYNQQSLFLAPSLEPALTQPLGALWAAEISLPASATLRASAGEDVDAGGKLTFVHESKVRTFSLKVLGAYVKQSGTLDPDQSLENMVYKISAELKSRGSVSTRLGYTFSKVDDINSTRRDIGNKIQVKYGFKPSDHFFPGFGAGLGINNSNVREYSYYELDFSLNSTIVTGEKNTFMAMLYANLRRYRTEKAPRNIISDKKKGGTAENNGSSTNNFAFMLLYSRNLSEKIDLEISYDYSVYAPILNKLMDGSHKISAGVSWSLNPL
jgi:hypothetical protein